jgi:hypothetical protein
MRLSRYCGRFWKLYTNIGCLTGDGYAYAYAHCISRDIQIGKDILSSTGTIFNKLDDDKDRQSF